MFNIRVPLSHLSCSSTAFLTSTNGSSILPDAIDRNLNHWLHAFHPTLKQPENSVGCTLTISQFQPLPTSTVTSFISAKLTSHQDHCISLPAGFLFLHWPPWCQQPECSSLHLRRITPLLKPFQELLKPLKLKSRCLQWHYEALWNLAFQDLFDLMVNYFAFLCVLQPNWPPCCSSNRLDATVLLDYLQEYCLQGSPKPIPSSPPSGHSSTITSPDPHQSLLNDNTILATLYPLSLLHFPHSTCDSLPHHIFYLSYFCLPPDMYTLQGQRFFWTLFCTMASLSSS